MQNDYGIDAQVRDSSEGARKASVRVQRLNCEVFSEAPICLTSGQTHKLCTRDWSAFL